MSRPRRRGPKGVSLLELLIVVAILGIATAMAVPNLMPTVAGHRLHAQTLAVTGFVDTIRRRAIADGRCYRIYQSDPTNPKSSLVAERRNSSDCVNLATPSTGGWTHAAVLSSESGTTFSIESRLPATLPSPFLDTALSPKEKHHVIFRPNGRLWGDGDLDTSDDGARINVSSPNARETRAVVVNSIGRVCARNYGVSTTAPAVGNAGALECD